MRSRVELFEAIRKDRRRRRPEKQRQQPGEVPGQVDQTRETANREVSMPTLSVDPEWIGGSVRVSRAGFSSGRALRLLTRGSLAPIGHHGIAPRTDVTLDESIPVLSFADQLHDRLHQ